jgi:2-phospho-L-lactate guanylyltransferase
VIAALVPVKRLDLAKSRLSPLGDRAFTRRLALAMLADVLEPLLASARIGDVAVVTEDEDVADAARAAGARAIVLVDAGLNESLRTASATLAHDGADGVLVVLGDVAGVTAADIDALLDALETLGGRGVVLAPARDGGTAALLRAPHDAIEARFGDASAAAHREAAARSAVPLREIERPGLAIDLDDPDDVAAFLRTTGGGARTRALLSRHPVTIP